MNSFDFVKNFISNDFPHNGGMSSVVYSTVNFLSRAYTFVSDHTLFYVDQYDVM